MGFEFLLVNYTDSVEIKEGEERKGEQEAAKVTSLSPRDSSPGNQLSGFLYFLLPCPVHVWLFPSLRTTLALVLPSYLILGKSGNGFMPQFFHL